MDYISHEDYARNVEARRSKEYHPIISPVIFGQPLGEFHNLTDELDAIKKALFYGKRLSDIEHQMMDRLAPRPAHAEGLPNYFGLVKETNEPIVLSDDQLQIFHAILGIATEVGELVFGFISALSDVQQNKKPIDDAFDHVNMREEAGDVLWYVQLLLTAIKSNIPEAMTINDNKLERRYGPAFSAERANERDLDAERKELEK